MILKEIWKSVKGYEDYEVSDLGNVRSLNYYRSGKVRELKPTLYNNGYLHVNLWKNGKMKKFYIHRLVYEAFRGAIPKGLTVDHVNNVKTDNRLENLQLLTQGDNTRKARNKQLDLIEADWPYRELTFKNSCIASEFFDYKYKRQVGGLISKARKRGENFINIRNKKYFFAQEA